MEIKKEVKKYLTAWLQWLIYDPDSLPKTRPKIAVVGGGSGLSQLLRGLKHYSHNLSAIVTVFDSGGSTGKLRKEFNVPAMGDIRNCLVALAQDRDLMKDIFDHRFKNGKDFKDHSVGNILLTTVLEKTNNLDEATQLAGKILNIKGQVIPSSLGNGHLKAKLENGQKIEGEDQIPEKVVEEKSPIKKIWLEPKQKANPRALKTIKKADLLILGPGSLYTSILPNLLVEGITKTVKKSSTPTLYITNVAQERGETNYYSVLDHIDRIIEYGVKPDFALVNSNTVAKTDNINQKGTINNITTSKDEYKKIKIIKKDLIDEKNPLYHSPNKLAQTVIKITKKLCK